MPLVRAEVKVQYHLCASLTGQFRTEEGGAPAWVLAQIGTCKLEDVALGYGGSQNVIDRQLNIGAVVPVVDQGESVWRFDAQRHGTGPAARFAGAKAGFNPLFFQEVENKIAHGIFAQTCEESRFQAQPPGPHTDIGR